MVDRYSRTALATPDNIPQCMFHDCKEKVALIPVEYGYFDFCVESYFPKEEWDIKKLEVRKLMNNAIIYGNLMYCPEHEEHEFRGILDAVYSGPRKSEEPTLAAFYTQKANEHQWDMLYTQLCNNEDSLRRSLLKTFEHEKEFAKESEKSNLERMSEFRWFTDLNYYWIPSRWKRDFKVDTYLGKTSSLQGKYNGPDFVFIDTTNGEKYGFEIFELNPTEFDVSKIKDIDKFSEKIYKQINKEKGGSFYRNYINARKQLDRKIEKWSNYINVDEKAVGIIMNGSVRDEWYYFLELLLNNDPKYHEFFYWIYLI